MSDTLHHRLIKRACREHGWRVGNWREALAAQLARANWHDPDYDEVPDVLEAAGAVWAQPDAWKFHEEGPEHGRGHLVLVLEFLEVEVNSHVGEAKLQNYETFWRMLDATEVAELRIFRLDRFGFLSPLLTEATAAALVVRRSRCGMAP